MAVPQNKKSHSRTRMRRMRAATRRPTLCLERGRRGARASGAGELRRRHHIGADGVYRGVQYFVPKTDLNQEED